MIRSLKRWAREAEDRLRYSPLVKQLLGRYRLFRDRAPAGPDAQNVARSIARLAAVARLAPGDATQREAETRIAQRLPLLDVSKVDWREFLPGVDHRFIPTAAILKAPLGAREKGVLFFSFEEAWTKLLHFCDVRAVAERYTLIIAPSWSPPHCLSTIVFAHAWPGPLFSLISNTADLETLPRLAPNYLPVPLFASNWVDPDLYRPLPRRQRDIDLVMVANFGKFKRHMALFGALRQMAPQLRVLLIGQDQDGRTADTIRVEAQWYGVRQPLTILRNAAYEEVTHHLCRARASVILSRREGSCVAVVESLFADTPVGLLRDAAIGSRVFLNQHTGRVLDETHLARDLMALLEQAEQCAPRRWVEDNHVSYHRSSQILNEIVKQQALAAGQEWTRDLAPLCWRPNPFVVRPEDRQRLWSARQEFNERFGLELGKPEPEGHPDSARLAEVAAS